MKKLFVTTTVIGSLLSSPVFARTEGNYVGLDIIRTGIEAGNTVTNGVSNNNLYKIQDEDQLSVGLSYRHALNFNNFFIAPGIFFDYSNVSAKDSDKDSWSLDYRLGIKADIGYDITEKFAAFANIGFASNHYDVDWKSVSSKNSDSDQSLLYGFGVKYSIMDNIDANLGYEISDFEMESPGNNTNEATEFDLKVVRLGVAFKF